MYTDYRNFQKVLTVEGLKVDSMALYIDGRRWKVEGRPEWTTPGLRRGGPVQGRFEYGSGKNL